MRDKKYLQDRKLKVKYSTSVLSTPINFVQNSHLTLTDEWQNLVEEVEGIITRLGRTQDDRLKFKIQFLRQFSVVGPCCYNND
jgi:hypothetical protein